MDVAIVKYNAGNIYSVVNAMKRLGINPILTDDAETLQKADRVLFPGQGQAREAMEYLKAHQLDHVRISNDAMQTSGIFRISDGEYFYFYVYISGEDAVLKDCKVPVSSVTLSLPTKKDTERIQVALAKNKLEWAARSKVLRTVDNARAKKGGKYWYFSERFSICGDIDMYTKKHNMRHDNGNYFCSYDSAVLFINNSLTDMEGDKDKLGRERERMARALDARRQELRTYVNNLGFLSSKSKSGDSLVREMEGKMRRLEGEIADLEQRIRLVDSKL